MDANRIAVLACLHMADQLRSVERELAEHKQRVDQKTRHFSLLLDQAIE
jgi:cell division protein ZapA